MNKREAKRERGRGKGTLNIELKTEGKLTDMKRERKQQCVTSGREGSAKNETIHPFLLLEAKKRTGRQQCTTGDLRHLIGDEEKQAKSQVQNE